MMFFTKIAIILLLTCRALADDPKTEDRCSVLTKCSECTIEAVRQEEEAEEYGERVEEGNLCEWSIEGQVCLSQTSGPDPTISTTAVRHPSDCPRFSVVHSRAIYGEEFAYSVKVSNDVEAGLITYLGRVGFTCLTNKGGQLVGRLDGSVITCEPVVWNGSVGDDVGGGQSEPLMSVEHFYILFGRYNVTLRLDHDADYYVSFYQHNCGVDGGYDDGCVECAWTADDSRYYVKRCSRRNQCVGPFELYDKRSVKGVDKHLSRWVDGERTMCEHAITVEWFTPTVVPWTADALTVTMEVRNHGILAEGANISVTVAGRDCKHPSTSHDDGGNVLTCTVSAEQKVVGSEGPVRVVYATGRQLVVESTEHFSFISPKVTGLLGPSCGPLAGRTRLTVTGTGFNATRAVRVFIVWADGVAPCPVIKLTHNRILFFTAPRPVPTVYGRVRVDFDASLSFFAPGLGFAYTDAPRPTPGQRLSGIVSGGTLFTVRFDGLQCVDEGSVFFSVHSQHRTCRVEREDVVCQSPGLVDSLSDQEKEGSGAGDAGINGRDGGEPGYVSPIASLDCSFGLQFAGDPVTQKCPEYGYAVYADPQFVDFEVTGNVIVIYGRGELGLGFGAHDVFVRFRDRRADECEVQWMGPDRIECAADRKAMARVRGKNGGLREVLVTVGHAATVTVPARQRNRDASATGDRTSGSAANDAAITIIVVAIAVGALMAFVYVMKERKKRMVAAGTVAIDDELDLHESTPADDGMSDYDLTEFSSSSRRSFYTCH